MDQNPYESPREEPSPPPGKVDLAKLKRQNKTAAIVILVLLSFPASFIAFFCVCNATGEGTIGGPPTRWGLAPAFAAAALVAGAFLCAIVMTWKRYQGD